LTLAPRARARHFSARIASVGIVLAFVYACSNTAPTLGPTRGS
jgi:hypothetical protein